MLNGFYCLGEMSFGVGALLRANVKLVDLAVQMVIKLVFVIFTIFPVAGNFLLSPQPSDLQESVSTFRQHF